MNSLVSHVISSLVFDLNDYLLLIACLHTAKVQTPVVTTWEADIYGYIVGFSSDLYRLDMHQAHNLLDVGHLYLESFLGVVDGLDGTEMHRERKVCERLYDAVCLTEGEILPQLLQSPEFPRHRQHGLVVKVQDIGLLPMEKHFLELEQLLVHLEVRLRPIGADLEGDRVWVVFDAAQ